MSLTSELKRTGSPLKAVLKKHYPDALSVVREARAEIVGRETFKAADKLPWSLIGTAFNNRLCLYYPNAAEKFLGSPACLGLSYACGFKAPIPFPVKKAESGGKFEIDHEIMDEILSPAVYSDSPPDDSYDMCFDNDTGSYVVGAWTRSTHLPMRSYPVEQSLSAEVAAELVCCYLNLLQERYVAGNRLSKEDEVQLLRYCLALATFESLSRGGDAVRGYIPPRFTAPDQSVEELLNDASDDCIADLLKLSTKFYENYGDLIQLPATINPTFSLGGIVGGADADIIVNGCLIDIKTTLNPFSDKDPTFPLYQLIGYVLLDENDKLHIDEVGVYFSRQATLIKWPLTSFLQKVSGNTGTDIRVVREELISVYKTGRA
jgi:hypothetical protein